MKTYMKLGFWSVLTVLFFTTSVLAQDVDPADSTGLPGDNFSLEGAIELFKKAQSLEDFEKLLNTESNNVNNLDLNEDGDIDYIRVVDNMDGDVHAIVLQVPVSASESQDIAVIEIEKQGNEEAILQIIGDEDIYGEQVIVEPFEEEPTKKGGGPSIDEEMVRVVVNVWLWPSVRFVYAPGYRVWVSPWRWSYYPTWWRPWRPHPWRVFHVNVRPFHRHYHVVTTHRVVRAHKVYAPRRTSSKVVHTRTTVVKGRRGNVVGKRTTTTTKVTGKRGNSVTTKKTNTAVKRRRGG
ncbi:MAG: hypothetical protein SFU99_12685 [Saprospiraceae bacterium]|nr:hypothetical protein [Saprospiraceae bacterium]